MKEKYCDLHVHSIYSDGTYTPEEILCAAEAAGLSAVALCDHNTVDGVEHFRRAAEGKRVEAILGAEFSVDYEGDELHLLGLYLPETAIPILNERMVEVQRLKDESNVDLIDRLGRAGYEISYEEIKSRTPGGKFNRAHVALALTEKGYTPSIKDAFRTVLSPDAGYYRAPERIPIFEMLDLLTELNVVPVLAHPLFTLSPERLAAFLPQAKKRGLVGMECYYVSYSPRSMALSLGLADTNRLLYSGGSDFHGATKPDVKLGVGRGNLQIPYRWAEALREAQKR